MKKHYSKLDRYICNTTLIKCAINAHTLCERFKVNTNVIFVCTCKCHQKVKSVSLIPDTWYEAHKNVV